jgi:UDP-glucose 4,6-dehydratase
METYRPKSVLVTGGCGFIASNFLMYMVPKHPEIHFINVDKVEYCSTLKGVKHLENYRNYSFYPTNIANTSFIQYILETHAVDTIIHFAAQSHVDNSFGNSISFTVDNVLGTHHLLETVRKYGNVKRFIHVSTDEVYGEVSIDETSSEKSVLNPTNPYAASKAAAEFIVKSYNKSYGIPIIITRGNNVYGKGQYPEKLIPKFIQQLMRGEKMTIHGKGETIRNFVHVEDVAKAFETILFYGKDSEIYNIGTENEHSVMQIAKQLFSIMGQTTFENCIEFVEDRPFNDFRYSIHTEKLNDLGWKPMIDFEEGLKQTVDWYAKRPSDYFVG